MMQSVFAAMLPRCGQVTHKAPSLAQQPSPTASCRPPCLLYSARPLTTKYIDGQAAISPEWKRTSPFERFRRFNAKWQTRPIIGRLTLPYCKNKGCFDSTPMLSSWWSSTFKEVEMSSRARTSLSGMCFRCCCKMNLAFRWILHASRCDTLLANKYSFKQFSCAASGDLLRSNCMIAEDKLPTTDAEVAKANKSTITANTRS
mmetsp:Transcript_85445/g.246933  ORF Transcript_85445/g.246933 Transcript_85445/m.246933 type:complete len:202 (-) Transcript_85445:1336-1941(-)